MTAWLTTTFKRSTMKATVIALLTAVSPTAYAAERLLLVDFIRDIRDQLYSIESESNEHAVGAMIKNVHVEAYVVAEKDQHGRMSYYVLEGEVDKTDIVAQKLSFDLELKPSVSMNAVKQGYRSYSTRNNVKRYGTDRHQQYRHYPHPTDRYMPDTYPVILYNPER